MLHVIHTGSHGHDGGRHGRVKIGNGRGRCVDLLHGDRDGMVVIPNEILDEVIAASVDAMAKENLVRTAILEGVDPQEAYLRHGKF